MNDIEKVLLSFSIDDLDRLAKSKQNYLCIEMRYFKRTGRIKYVLSNNPYRYECLPQWTVVEMIQVKHLIKNLTRYE